MDFDKIEKAYNVYKIDEYAQKEGVTRATVHRRIRMGTVKTVKVEGKRKQYIIEPKVLSKKEFVSRLMNERAKNKRIKEKEVDNYEIGARQRLKGAAPIKRKRGGYQ